MMAPYERPKAWPTPPAAAEAGQGAQPLHPDDLRVLRADAARSAARLRAGARDGGSLPVAGPAEEARRLLAMRDYLLAMAVRYHGLAKQWQQAEGDCYVVDDDPTIPRLEGDEFDALETEGSSPGAASASWWAGPASGSMSHGATRREPQAIPLIRPRRAKPRRES